MDLTPLQHLFIVKGRMELHNRMNSTDEKDDSSTFNKKASRKDIFEE